MSSLAQAWRIPPRVEVVEALKGKRVDPTLRGFQRDGVNWLKAHGYTAILADAPGTGKTAQTLVAVSEDRARLLPVLVVCPSSVAWNWRREARMWAPGLTTIVVEGLHSTLPMVPPAITICPWDLLAPHIDALRAVGFKLVVGDECFPPGTAIAASGGDVPIDRIVPGQLVYARTQSGAVVLRRVLRVIKRPMRKELLRIVSSSGSFICTQDHKVWTEEEGYVPAARLHGGHHLRVLRETGEKGMDGARTTAFLRYEMLSQVAKSTSPRHRGKQGKGGCAAREKPRCPATRSGDAYARKESNAGRIYSGAHEANPPRAGTQAAAIGGKWASAARCPSPSVFRVGATRVYLRATLRDLAEGSVQLRAEVLALWNRHSRSYNTYRCRSGWGQPHEQEGAATRCPQGRHPSPPRVVCVAIYEPRSAREYQRDSATHTGDSGFVYDLEVEGCHNYFAERHLVSNCHFAKNPASLRGLAFAQICQETPHKILLTGTPLINTVDEFDVIKGLTGNPNPPLLRRLLEDVAKDIPAKTRISLDVSITPAAMREYRQAEQEFGAYLDTMLRVQGTADAERVAKKTMSAASLTRVGYLRRILGRAKAMSAAAWIVRQIRAGEPVVVFCEHQDVIDTLCTTLDGVGIKYGRLDGATARRDRQRAIDGFQNGDLAVFIGSKAAKEGITLHRARHLLFVERWWTPAEEEQAEDRIRRIGQRHATYVWFMQVPDTYDERVAEIVEAKRKLVGEHIGNAEIQRQDATGLLGEWLRGQPADATDLELPEFPTLPHGTKVHAFVFAARNWNADAVGRWLKLHGFKAQAILVGDKSVKAVLRTSAGYVPGSFRSVSLGPDFGAIVGQPRRVRQVVSYRQRNPKRRRE